MSLLTLRSNFWWITIINDCQYYHKKDTSKVCVIWSSPRELILVQIINLDCRLQKTQLKLIVTHKTRKRFRHYSRNVLHETYLIKFRFEKLCEVWKTDILSIIAELLSIRGVLMFLFIMNKPIDKHQDAGMFCWSNCFSKSKYDAGYNCNKSQPMREGNFIKKDKKGPHKKRDCSKKSKWLKKTKKRTLQFIRHK